MKNAIKNTECAALFHLFLYWTATFMHRNGGITLLIKNQEFWYIVENPWGIPQELQQVLFHLYPPPSFNLFILLENKGAVKVVILPSETPSETCLRKQMSIWRGGFWLSFLYRHRSCLAQNKLLPVISLLMWPDSLADEDKNSLHIGIRGLPEFGSPCKVHYLTQKFYT